MWRRVWESLSDDARRAFVADLAQLDRRRWLSSLVTEIAARLNFRRQSIERCATAQLENHVARILPSLPDRLVGRLLLGVHVERRLPIVNAVHDRLGWPPVDVPRSDGDGSVDSDDRWSGVEVPSVDALRGARSAMAPLDPSDDGWLLLLAGLAYAGWPPVLEVAGEALRLELDARGLQSSAQDARADRLGHDRPTSNVVAEGRPVATDGSVGAGDASGSRLLEAHSDTGCAQESLDESPIDSRAAAEVANGITVPAASSSKSAGADRGDQPDSVALDVREVLPGVSALIGIAGSADRLLDVHTQYGRIDQMLTEQLVGMLLAEQDGSMSTRQGRSLVESLVEINPSRSISRFHQGFFDAISGEAFAPDGPGWNMERRLWYAHGWMMGLERSKGERAALSEFERWRSEGLPFLDPIRDASQAEEPRWLLAEQLSRLAIGAGRSDLVRLAVATGVPIHPRWLDRLLKWLLASRDPSGAEHRLVVARRVQQFVNRQGSRLPPEVSCIVAGAVVRALRDSTRFDVDPPRVRFDGSVDPLAMEVLESELLLFRLRIGSLETFASRTPNQWRDLATRLAPHRTQLARPWHPRAGALVSLIASLPILHSETDWKLREHRERAIGLLTTTIETLSLAESGSAEHRLLELATWWRQGLRGAYPDGEAGEDALLAFEGEAEIGGWLPRTIHAECIVNANLAGRTLAERRLLEAYVSAFGLKALHEGDLLQQCLLPDVVIEEICRELDDPGRRRTLAFAVQWALADAVLSTSLDPVVASHADSEWAIDQLERLGHSPDPAMQREWVEFLHRDDRALRCFEQVDELDQAKLAALDRVGDFDAAAQQVVERLEHAWQRADRDVVADLVAWLDERHRGECVRPEMRQRAEPPAPAATGDERRACRVLFIGGNECQAQYESELRSIFKRQDPGLTIEFEPIGWSSNWGREVDRLQTGILRADVVVLMTFIRTQCGRTLRRRIGEAGRTWISCTGHGRASMERAIRHAAALARRVNG